MTATKVTQEEIDIERAKFDEIYEDHWKTWVPNSKTGDDYLRGVIAARKLYGYVSYEETENVSIFDDGNTYECKHCHRRWHAQIVPRSGGWLEPHSDLCTDCFPEKAAAALEENYVIAKNVAAKRARV